MRIFVDPDALVTGEVSITGEEHHYLGRVRRVRVGQAIELVDGAGKRAAATIVRMTEIATVVEVAEVVEVVEAAPHVRVLVPLLKGDRMDGCLEKLTEVGASELIVWQAERSRRSGSPRRCARSSGRCPPVTASSSTPRPSAASPRARPMSRWSAGPRVGSAGSSSIRWRRPGSCRWGSARGCSVPTPRRSSRSRWSGPRPRAEPAICLPNRPRRIRSP
jgi:hypothetical protein